MPKILKIEISQHFRRPRWADHLRSGVRDQPGQHGKTPSLLKIQILASQAQWLKPVIPALRRVNHLRSGVRDQPDQHGEMPTLLKNRKLAACGGACL